MMNIWLVADTHFGHRKMTELCGRPPRFEELLYKNIIAVVKPDDVLLHLGDFCIGHDEKWHELFMELKVLRKWLIRGNHDNKSDCWYLNHGWDFVGDELILSKYGKRILFSHAPQPIGMYDINIHGHLHNSTHHNDEIELIRHSGQMLLAMEYTQYKPVNLKNFIEGKGVKI